jgi:hypothetical protein
MAVTLRIFPGEGMTLYLTIMGPKPQWLNSAIRMMIGIGTPRNQSKSERMG